MNISIRGASLGHFSVLWKYMCLRKQKILWFCRRKLCTEPHHTTRHAHRNMVVLCQRERAERWRSCLHSHWVRLPTVAIDVTTTFWAGREFDCQNNKEEKMAKWNEFFFLSFRQRKFLVIKTSKTAVVYLRVICFFQFISHAETTNENGETYILPLSIV